MSMSKRLTKFAFVALIAALACVFAAGCSSQSGSASSAASESAASASAASESAAASEPAAASESASAAPTADGATLGVAYQTGLSYAPALIAKEQGLVEKYYKEATGADVAIEWTQMSSGADINTAITSGSLDVGMMGIGPVVTGITSGLDYKICANLSGWEYGLMSNDESIKTLADLVGSQHQISLVNIGSIGHILLAKALVDNGFGAHDLDSNLVALSNPDGMNAVLSGNVACNLTYSTFLSAERADASLHELTEVVQAWPKENTNVVAVASTALYEDQDLYKAFCDAIAEGKKFIAEHPEDAAALLAEYDGNDPADELKYLQEGTFNDETKGVFEIAQFMADNDFIDNAPESYESLVFDNVQGN